MKISRKYLIFWILPLFLIFRSTVLIRSRAPNEFSAIDTYALLDIIVTIATFVSIFWLLILNFYFKENFKLIFKHSLLFFVLYYILCMISALWSKYPEFTLYRSFEFIMQFAIIFLLIATFKDIISAEKIVLLLCVLTIIFTLISHYIIMGGFLIEVYAWHTNTYSASAGMVFIYCVAELLNSKSKKRSIYLIIFAIISFFFLLIGTSSASFIALILTLILLIIISRNGLLYLLFVPLILFIYLTGEYTNLIDQYVFFGKPDDEKWTLTGREKLWEDYNFFIIDSPYIGHGFAIIARIGATMTTNPHNFIYSVLLGTGILGAVFFSTFLIKLIQEVTKYSLKIKENIGVAIAVLFGIINATSMPLFADIWTMSPSFVFTCFFSMFIIFNVIPLKKAQVKEIC